MEAMLTGIRSKFNDVHHLTTEKLHDIIHNSADNDTSVLLIDARPISEYSVSHISGAECLPHDATDGDLDKLFKEHIQPKLGENKMTIVCYCSVGYRSSILARRLHDMVDEVNKESVSIHNLDGSLFKWANEGRPMVDVNNETTVFAHPYNMVFGLLLNSKLRKYVN